MPFNIKKKLSTCQRHMHVVSSGQCARLYYTSDSTFSLSCIAIKPVSENILKQKYIVFVNTDHIDTLHIMSYTQYQQHFHVLET